MDVSPITAWLRERLLTLRERNFYLPAGAPFAQLHHLEVQIYDVGARRWVRVAARCRYDMEEPWTDFADYISRDEEHSWVGPIEGAPVAPSAAQLDAWAHVKARYISEETQEEGQVRRAHEGARVLALDRYRGAAVQEAAGLGASPADPYAFAAEVWSPL